MSRTSTVLFLFSLFVGLPLSTAIAQTTWYVDDDCPGPGTGSEQDPFCSIQEGIDAAADGDTVLVLPGTYVENIDFGGRAIHVVSHDGPEVTVIDGGEPLDPDHGSVVTFASHEGPDSIIDGFTLTKGSGTFTDPYYQHGGGIYCDESSPTIIHNIITWNWTIDDGGGIYCNHGNPTILDNTISTNWTGVGSGGAIFCFAGSSPTIENNTITMNYARASGGGIGCSHCNYVAILDNTITLNSAEESGGGAIVCTDSYDATIAQNLIADNEAPSGGGIHCGGGALLMIRNNVMRQNYATVYDGGGISCFSSATILNNEFIKNAADFGWGGAVYAWMDATPSIEANILRDNSASKGGGIACSMSRARLVGNWILRNRAAEDGGGIFIGNVSSPLVLNNLIVRNVAEDGDGGGIHAHISSGIIVINTMVLNSASRGGAVGSAYSTLSVANSILWNNNATVEGSEIWHDSVAANVTYCDVQGGWPGEGNIDVNPLFLDPGQGDFRLCQAPCEPGVDNPCVDASNPASTMLEGTTRSDGAQDAGILDMGYHYTYDSEYRCRLGMVDRANSFPPAVVLLVNGIPGDDQRVVTVSLNEAVVISMVVPPGGPDPAPFCLYSWLGEPSEATVTPQPSNLGDMCFPTPLTGGIPHYKKVWNNMGQFPRLGGPGRPSTPAPSIVEELPTGVGAAVTATFQGFILDNGSSASEAVSITNAVILKVE